MNSSFLFPGKKIKNVNMTLLLHSFGISVDNIQVLMIFLTSYLLKANNKI